MYIIPEGIMPCGAHASTLLCGMPRRYRPPLPLPPPPFTPTNPPPPCPHRTYGHTRRRRRATLCASSLCVCDDECATQRLITCQTFMRKRRRRLRLPSISACLSFVVFGVCVCVCLFWCRLCDGDTALRHLWFACAFRCCCFCCGSAGAMQFDSWSLARARIKTNSYEIVLRTLHGAHDACARARLRRCCCYVVMRMCTERVREFPHTGCSATRRGGLLVGGYDGGVVGWHWADVALALSHQQTDASASSHACIQLRLNGGERIAVNCGMRRRE